MGASLRCFDFIRHPNIDRCSHYIGPYRDRYIELPYGPEYRDTTSKTPKDKKKRRDWCKVEIISDQTEMFTKESEK